MTDLNVCLDMFEESMKTKDMNLMGVCLDGLGMIGKDFCDQGNMEDARMVLALIGKGEDLIEYYSNR